MEQEELLQHLRKGDIDLRPFFAKTFSEDFPDKMVIAEEAWHYTLCKYKIGLIKNNQGLIINYYIYEQIRQHDSGESKTEQPEHSESEGKFPIGQSGTDQEKDQEVQGTNES